MSRQATSRRRKPPTDAQAKTAYLALLKVERADLATVEALFEESGALILALSKREEAGAVTARIDERLQALRRDLFEIGERRDHVRNLILLLEHRITLIDRVVELEKHAHRHEHDNKGAKIVPAIPTTGEVKR